MLPSSGDGVTLQVNVVQLLLPVRSLNGDGTLQCLVSERETPGTDCLDQLKRARHLTLTVCPMGKSKTPNPDSLGLSMNYSLTVRCSPDIKQATWIQSQPEKQHFTVGREVDKSHIK